MEPTGLIPPNSTFSFTISQEEANKRLDHYIAKQFPLYSRSFFQRVIEELIPVVYVVYVALRL